MFLYYYIIISLYYFLLSYTINILEYYYGDRGILCFVDFECIVTWTRPYVPCCQFFVAVDIAWVLPGSIMPETSCLDFS